MVFFKGFNGLLIGSSQHEGLYSDCPIIVHSRSGREYVNWSSSWDEYEQSKNKVQRLSGS